MSLCLILNQKIPGGIIFSKCYREPKYYLFSELKCKIKFNSFGLKCPRYAVFGIIVLINYTRNPNIVKQIRVVITLA